MPKRKIFNYPIKELEELLRDLRRDWRDMRYWEKLYSQKGKYDNLDSDSRDAIKRALKGLRYKKTVIEKKILSVDLAIKTLKERNLIWGFGVRSKKEMAQMTRYLLT